MGNDGSGWSMSVWPRRVRREGQDGTTFDPIKYPSTRLVRRPPRVKRDAEKFEAGLTKAMGAKAAKAYLKGKRPKRATGALRPKRRRPL